MRVSVLRRAPLAEGGKIHIHAAAHWPHLHGSDAGRQLVTGRLGVRWNMPNVEKRPSTRNGSVTKGEI